MSFWKDVLGDVRSWAVGIAMTLLVSGIIFILAPVGAAILKSMKSEPVPWATLIIVAIVGVGLIAVAIKLLRAREPSEDDHEPVSPVSPSQQGFSIEALPPIPDLKNITQISWEKANVMFTGDAAVRVRNLLPAQGIDLAHFRLLSVTPPMDAQKSWKGHTQDTVLERIDFSDDMPATVVAGKAHTIRLFKATRPPSAKDLKEISIEFYGKWPDEYYSTLYPAERHLLIVEVTGNGVSRTEETFELRFSANKAEPVFTLTKLAGTGPSPIEKKDQGPPRSDVIRHEAFERRQAEEGIAIHLPRANELKRPIHFYYDQLKALIETGSDMLESLKSNTAPVPAKGEVDEWVRQLDDVVTCCATVAERQALKNSRIGLAFEPAFLDIAAVAPGEHYDAITEIFSKLTVAKGIAARIHRRTGVSLPPFRRCSSVGYTSSR